MLKDTFEFFGTGTLTRFEDEPGQLDKSTVVANLNAARSLMNNENKFVEF